MKISSSISKPSKNGLILICCLMVFNVAKAQRDLKSGSVFTPIYGIIYKGSFSGGDFAKRWGYSNAIGLEANFKLKNSLSFGVESQFMFGNTFRDSAIFENVWNSNGGITGLSGAPGDLLYLLRGGMFTGQVGYVFSQVGKNPNAGLWLNFGLGYQFHKISIQSIYDPVSQFSGSYVKGYDKLSMGLVSKQFIGYLQQGDKDFLNFYAGFEFSQGFTKNVRTYNFDTEGPENDLRLDLMFGFKVGWMIPIYKRQLQDYYY